MPTTEAYRLLDDALQTHQYRLCSIVPGDNNFGVSRKNRKLFVADDFIPERRQNPRRTQLMLQHFPPLSSIVKTELP